MCSSLAKVFRAWDRFVTDDFLGARIERALTNGFIATELLQPTELDVTNILPPT